MINKILTYWILYSSRTRHNKSKHAIKNKDVYGLLKYFNIQLIFTKRGKVLNVKQITGMNILIKDIKCLFHWLPLTLFVRCQYLADKSYDKLLFFTINSTILYLWNISFRNCESKNCIFSIEAKQIIIAYSTSLLIVYS